MMEIKLQSLLEAAVIRCMGHGRTALQLSGGLDSAVIQAIGHFDDLYCCTWPEFDNITAARQASLGRPITPVTFTREELLVTLPDVARVTEGKGTWSQCCQWIMAQRMKADGIQVVLNGEGADELFGGYARYRVLYWIEQMLSDPHLVEYLGVIEHTLAAMACNMGVGGDREALRGFLVNRMLTRTSPHDGYNGDKRGDMLAMVADHDERVGLKELVGFEDAIFQEHGIVHFHPFMDPEVVEFAHTIPTGWKVTETESKHVLRLVARRLGVNPAITNEVTKRGLVIPPTWAPGDAKKWSRGWFERFMEEAWRELQGLPTANRVKSKVVLNASRR